MLPIFEAIRLVFDAYQASQTSSRSDLAKMFYRVYYHLGTCIECLASNPPNQQKWELNVRRYNSYVSEVAKVLEVWNNELMGANTIKTIRDPSIDVSNDKQRRAHLATMIALREDFRQFISENFEMEDLL